MANVNFDLEGKSEAGAWMRLRHPGTGEFLGTDDEPCRIKLKSSDSNSYIEAVARSVADRGMKRTAPDRITAIELLDEAGKNDAAIVKHLVACTLGWENLTITDDDDFPFTKENGELLYDKHKWIREQANLFVNDRVNYLGNA